MHSIERQVLLRAPRSRVWNALTDVKKFCQWFGVNSADGVFAPGAKLRMGVSEEYGGHFNMVVEQMQPEHLFSWRWHPGVREASVDYEKEPTTLVVFKLADAEGGTLLTITESGFDAISLARRARVFGQNNQGWDEQVKNLERYVSQAS
jgi:uncharacterized protein YndB with AHSA1/START domain